MESQEYPSYAIPALMAYHSPSAQQEPYQAHINHKAHVLAALTQETPSDLEQRLKEQYDPLAFHHDEKYPKS